MSVFITDEMLIEILTERLPRLLDEKPELRTSLLEIISKSLATKKDIEDLRDELQEFRVETRQRLDRMEGDVNVLKDDVKVLKDDVKVLKDDVKVLKDDVKVLKDDVKVLKDDVKVLKHDVSGLKGSSHERFYRDKAAGLFGKYLRRGHDVTNDIADQLYEAMEAGTISEHELDQVLAADLLWGGTLRINKEAIVVVLEASWRAEINDVERASTRATILRKIGLNAIGVVGGKEWDEQAQDLAKKEKVAMTTNGRIDKESWENANSRE